MQHPARSRRRPGGAQQEIRRGLPDGGSAPRSCETCCNATYAPRRRSRSATARAARSQYLPAADICRGQPREPVDNQFVYHSRGTVFSGDQKLLDGVENAGFDFVSVANNHIRDAGSDGIVETVKALKARGIASSGAGKGFANARKPAILETHGVTVAIFGCDAIAHSYWTSGSAIGSRKCDRTTLVADIKKARQSADVVIVYPHWGIEYRAKPSDSQRSLAKAWAKAGADLIIGNHAHWAAAMEAIRTTRSGMLGNLVQTNGRRRRGRHHLELTFQARRCADPQRPHLTASDKAQPNFMDPAGDGAAVLKRSRRLKSCGVLDSALKPSAQAARSSSNNAPPAMPAHTG